MKYSEQRVGSSPKYVNPKPGAAHGSVWEKILLAVATSSSVLALGTLRPRALILDMPFGLFYYVVDRLGLWQPGLLWAPNHRLLAILCFFAGPLFVSTIFGSVVSHIGYKIWTVGKKNSQLYALIFIVIILGLIFLVRVKPASYNFSYYGYWTANY